MKWNYMCKKLNLRDRWWTYVRCYQTVLVRFPTEVPSEFLVKAQISLVCVVCFSLLVRWCFSLCLTSWFIQVCTAVKPFAELQNEKDWLKLSHIAWIFVMIIIERTFDDAENNQQHSGKCFVTANRSSPCLCCDSTNIAQHGASNRKNLYVNFEAWTWFFIYSCHSIHS